MNQLIYIFLIVFISSIFSLIYQLLINKNKFIKIFLSLIFSFIFVYLCYLYNYFIFNIYVVISIILGCYFGYIVKNGVKKILINK